MGSKSVWDLCFFVIDSYNIYMNKQYKISIDLILEDDQSALALIDFVRRGAMAKALSGSVMISSEETIEESRVIVPIEVWEISEGKKVRIK